MIRLEGLTKRYGTFTAVNGIDLHVPRGELFGFLGPNGAGKTTTLRMIAGILRPTAGRIPAGRRRPHRRAHAGQGDPRLHSGPSVRAKNTSVGLRNDGSLRVNYLHPSLKGLKGKDYHRLYKRFYRQMKSNMLCDCGRRAVGVFGKEPICDVCFQAEGRGHTQDWRKRKGRPVRKESMGNSSGAFYEPPTNEIGHGSLALLEKHLAAIRPLGEGDKDALQLLANG